LWKWSYLDWFYKWDFSESITHEQSDNLLISNGANQKRTSSVDFVITCHEVFFINFVCLFHSFSNQVETLWDAVCQTKWNF
jgi:hypothetical protein